MDGSASRRCSKRSAVRRALPRSVRRSVSRSAGSRTASSNPTTWRSSCCGGRGLANADLDATVPRLGDLVGCPNLGLALAPARHRDPDFWDPELQELVATALGAPQRERVVVLLAADAVRVP